MQEFYNGLADILEVDAKEVTPALQLHDHIWDSLAIISVISLVDELFDKILAGPALSRCETVGDIDALLKPGATD
jgi:acyl carrier protein